MDSLLQTSRLHCACEPMRSLAQTPARLWGGRAESRACAQTSQARAQGAASCSAAQAHRQHSHRRRGPPALQSLTFEEGELAPEFEPGSRVKVTAELTVYHVPKHPELQLQGWEGELVENVVNFKGTKISANLPYKVQFVKPQEGAKDLKFVTHLRADEMEKL